MLLFTNKACLGLFLIAVSPVGMAFDITAIREFVKLNSDMVLFETSFREVFNEDYRADKTYCVKDMSNSIRGQITSILSNRIDLIEAITFSREIHREDCDEEIELDAVKYTTLATLDLTKAKQELQEIISYSNINFSHDTVEVNNDTIFRWYIHSRVDRNLGSSGYDSIYIDIIPHWDEIELFEDNILISVTEKHEAGTPTVKVSRSFSL